MTMFQPQCPTIQMQYDSDIANTSDMLSRLTHSETTYAAKGYVADYGGRKLFEKPVITFTNASNKPKNI